MCRIGRSKKSDQFRVRCLQLSSSIVAWTNLILTRIQIGDCVGLVGMGSGFSLRNGDGLWGDARGRDSSFRGDVQPVSVFSRQCERRQSSALFYPSVGFVQIYTGAVNGGFRCGQYAPLCGASVGLWPFPDRRCENITTQFGMQFSRS